MSKFDKLKQLLGGAADVMNRPGAAIRQGANALLSDQDPVQAVQAAAMEGKDVQGADIADKVSDKFNIQNPALLAGIATAADMADPLGAIGKVGKIGAVAKMASENFPGIKKLFKVGDKIFEAKNTADAMEVKKSLGMADKVLTVIGEDDPIRNVLTKVQKSNTLKKEMK